LYHAPKTDNIKPTGHLKVPRNSPRLNLIPLE
jgi:hypothetical protein